MSQLLFESLQDDACIDLLDTLYAAPGDAAGWLPFLQKLVQATGSRSARMLVLDRQAQTVRSSIKHNIDDDVHARYVQHFVNECPWRPELKFKPPGRLYSSYIDFSCRQPDYYRTAFFHDWARSEDIHHGACGTVWQDREQTVQLLIQRCRQQGHYSAGETRLINQLVTHVRRAVRLQIQMAAVGQQQLGLGQAAAHRALPFLLLDGDGRIVHACEAARQLLAGHPALQVHGGRLYLPGGMQARLDGALYPLCHGDAAASAEPAAGEVLRLAGGASGDLHCVLTPLRSGHTPCGLWSGPAQALMMISLYQPGSEVLIDEALLSRLFRLSPAEARVAAGIARGLGPPDIALRHGLSAHTVRGQLKQVFAKTGTRRQNELASVVLASPAVRHARPATVVLGSVDSAPASEQ